MIRTWRKFPFAQVGRRLSSSHTRKIRNYLDTWVGSTPAQSNKVSPTAARPTATPHNNKSFMRPLLLSGSSYLMPTLRLERSDTPESLSARIAAALEESSAPSAVIVKSMLSGKATADGIARWRAPIVLDLGALVPDGSPHYVPPRKGLLSDMVNALEEFGISVVGITNPPSEVEHEAVKSLGLPSILSKSRALDRQTDAKFRVEDVVQLVLNRVAEEDDDVDATEMTETLGEDIITEISAVDETGAYELIHEGNRIEDHVNDTNGLDEATTRTVSDEEIELEANMSIPQTEAVPGGTKVYYGNVRSGQQIAAEKNQSLIVIGSVSSGGEVLADRDIFVLGKLRGRALAGLVPCSTEDGIESARIFASSFDAELVCIGETFTTVDNVQDLGLTRPGEAVMVSLNANSELVFESVQLK